MTTCLCSPVANSHFLSTNLDALYCGRYEQIQVGEAAEVLVLSAQSRFNNFKVSQLRDIWLADSSTLLRLPWHYQILQALLQSNTSNTGSASAS